MAKGRQRKAKSRSSRLPTMEQMKEFIRTDGVRYLDARNINSVGIGKKISTAEGPTGEVCIQFTVDRKTTAESVAALGSRMIPPVVVIGGKVVKTDVIERRFRSSWQLVKEAEIKKEDRKSRRDVIAPGVSIGHRDGTAGTVGAIVYDRATGVPLLLSNWHVLQMRADDSAGEVGDEVAQPGPFDDNDVANNIVGRVLRSHLGFAGDCAVASIEGRGFTSDVFDLKTAIARVARPELDDLVVKSGRTTDVTRGIVTRVEVQTKMTYGDLEVIVGGFEIGPEPKSDKNKEISMGGDSGSAWLAMDPHKRQATDVMLGLHFAGEASDDQPEFAMACAAHSVLEKLEVTLTPPDESAVVVTDGVAVVERAFGGSGYDPKFIGFSLPLPTAATKTVGDDLIGADGNKIAHYNHFSLSMRKSRRLAAFVAWNIDGKITKPANKDASWQIDQRIPAQFQVNNTLYKNTRFDRGHIAKREDLLWGGASAAKRANDDSFCYTNATPQHDQFNRLAPALWKSLEDELFRQVDVANLRIALIGGPIFHSNDLKFKPSGAPASFKAVGIPREFFKIIAYRDSADNAVKVLAFTLSQANLLTGKLEALSLEALDLQKFEMFQVRVSAIEKDTGLSMPAFRKLDTKAGPQAVGLEGVAAPDARLIRSFADIVR